jgi:hypothetical protein
MLSNGMLFHGHGQMAALAVAQSTTANINSQLAYTPVIQPPKSKEAKSKKKAENAEKAEIKRSVTTPT